ncbi:PfkB family carbohydrate kinase [Actinocorallia sp. A-T 12471]|uniref:PfkB family carbohydrate kinase n=1 Tax=Actinocorallia sp. A-T 12471 TaxID=3089813 RepID=UPI0029CD3C18|nr:PfkB family carbohydrate kinase [Actinocorallia sp. A-T 12471]MDX6742590.1 PfkB family carbohydrate kinase [Actinocorallia sp. A-T 12471]
MEEKSEGVAEGYTVTPESTVRHRTPIEDLGLPVRVYRALMRAGLDSVGKVVALERAALVERVAGLSDEMAGEVVAALLRHRATGPLVDEVPTDVLVLGGAGVDTVVRVAALPVPFADSVPAPGITEYAGHTGTGVAVGCAALGLRACLVDFFGRDPQADIVLQRLRDSGVTVTVLPARRTRRSVNLVDPSGRRMSFYDGQDEPGTRVPEETLRRLLRDARHVHVSIMDFARQVYPLLDGRSSSTDLHDWDGASTYHEDFAYSSDLVFLSSAALGPRTPEVMRRILDRGRAHTVIATDGAAGGRYLTRAEGTVRPYPAVTGTPAVDSNGAGDAFVSGFLYAHLNDLPLKTALHAGAIAGHHACTTPGIHTTPLSLTTLLPHLNPTP